MSEKQSADENKKRAVEPAGNETQQAETKSDSKTVASKKAPGTASGSTAKTPVKNKIPLLLALVSLSALAALTTSAALGWYGYQQLIQLEQQITERPTKQQLKVSLRNLSAIDDIKNQQNFIQQSLESQQQHLTAMQQALAKSSEPKPRDWLLAEVEYLLRLANQRLQLEEDIEGALTLMATAEQRLKQADVPGTLGIRSDLLEDIEELKALPKIDRVSIALSLQNLADQALSLKVQPLPEVPSINLDTATEAMTEPSWYQAWWQEIQRLIVIRKRELPIEALPFAEEELVLRHQLSALLLQASWAALRGEQQLYKTSLSGAMQRLTGFDASQPAVQAFDKQLQALAEQEVEQKLPETETSLDSLQAFIVQRYSLKLPVFSEKETTSEAHKKEVQP